VSLAVSSVALLSPAAHRALAVAVAGCWFDCAGACVFRSTQCWLAGFDLLCLVVVMIFLLCLTC